MQTQNFPTSINLYILKAISSTFLHKIDHILWQLHFHFMGNIIQYLFMKYKK